MPTPHVLILRAPGTNCDEETAFAFARAGGHPQRIHINQLVETPHMLHDYQIFCIPGGFSYGDDLAAGRVLASKLQLHLAEMLQEFKAADKLILGVCNGFQVILKAGLLLPRDQHGAQATLAWNDSGKFEDRWIHLRVVGQQCAFLQGIHRLELPVAHAEGRFVPRDEPTREALRHAGQLALRYTTAGGDEQVPYPANPNGSIDNVAGACDVTGRVFGLMPHPERFIDATQHPQWTRRGSSETGDGLPLFRNTVAYFR